MSLSLPPLATALAPASLRPLAAWTLEPGERLLERSNEQSHHFSVDRGSAPACGDRAGLDAHGGTRTPHGARLVKAGLLPLS